MKDRIADAVRTVRGRLLKAAREHGRTHDPKWLSDGFANPHAAPSDLFEGLDATSGEVAAALMNETRKANADKTALLRAAATGFGAHMAMHETNSLMSRVVSGLQGTMVDIEAGRDPKRRLQQAEDAARTVGRNFSFLAGDYGPKLTGAVVMQGLTREFYWLKDKRYASLRLEATDAFLAAELPMRRDSGLAIYVNLVRNALRWIGDEGAVRLDAWTVGLPPIDPDGEDEWDREPRSALLFSVEDSGPGIPEAQRDKVFTPFVSGRNSAGIGLHICRSMLERSSLGIRAEESAELGGARFVFGPISVVDPTPAPPEHERGVLALAAWSLAAAKADGDVHALRLGAPTWAEVQAERLRIAVEGPRDRIDIELAAGADAMSGLLAGRLQPDDVEWPADPAASPVSGR